MKGKSMQDFIAVLDFGSQYSHLISKRLRLLGVYLQILHPSTSEKFNKKYVEIVRVFEKDFSYMKSGEKMLIP